MKSKILVLFVLFVCSSFSRPIVFNVQKELKEASRIVKGSILSYENNILVFRNFTTGSIDSANVRGCSQLENSVQEVDMINNPNGGGQSLTMSVPANGDNILIVINNQNEVRLFAYERYNYYRFWALKSANSLTLFVCELPTLPITTNRNYYINGHCYDGCLYLINKIELRQ